MFNSKVLRNSSCFVLSSSLISTVQYSAGFATNQNFKYRLINVNGSNSAGSDSSASKSVIFDCIKYTPYVLLKVLKWGLITTLFLILVVLSLGFGAALYVCDRYGKGDSSCFRKLIEVGKFYWKSFNLDEAERAIKDDMVSFFDPQSGAEGHNMKVLRKFLEEKMKSQQHLLDHLFDDFSGLVNTENLVNDFFKIINIKCILGWLKKLAAKLEAKLKEKKDSKDFFNFFKKIEEGKINAQGVNSKLEKLYKEDGKFTLYQFIYVLFGKEEAPTQTLKLETKQNKSSLLEYDSTPSGDTDSE